MTAIQKSINRSEKRIMALADDVTALNQQIQAALAPVTPAIQAAKKASS